MLEQENFYTYLSENIEKHAKPNNTCYVHGIKSYIENTHPFVNNINFNYLNHEMKEYLDTLCEIGLLNKNNKQYTVDDHKKQGFPRLMIKIKDKQLLQLSRTKHKTQYRRMERFFEKDKTKKLKNMFGIINDIKVQDIVDKQSQKTAFMKILGSPYDFKQRVMMYGKNKQTLFAAFKRQVKTAPMPDETVTKDFINHSLNIIEKEMGQQLNDFGYDVSQWYNHLSRAKQSQINNIYNYYFHPERFQELDIKQQNETLSDHYTAIVKMEIQDLDGKPRMVCSIPQKTKFIMGPVTWQLEEIASKYLNGYCGGLNLNEIRDKLNNYLDEGFVKIVEGDGSAFDNTQDVTLKEIDRYIYRRVKNKVYHVPKKDFIKTANSYYKIMDINYLDTKYRKVKTLATEYVLGTVFSGDCDTTLMNTIRMVMYNRFVNDKAGLRYGVDYIVLAKGDDFSVLYKNYVTDEMIDNIYYKYFLPKSSGPDEITDKRQFGIGQILKFLDKGDCTTFKFCSLRSYRVDRLKDKITLIRDPSKLYNKALYSIKYKNYSVKQKYMYHIQQAISYITNYGGIEIFEIMAKNHYENAEKIKQTHNLKLNKKQVIIHEKMKEQMKLKNKITLDEIEFTDNSFVNKILYFLFDIKKRDKYINFYTDYWTQVSKVEKERKENNSILELEYINEQINREFDTEELKSLLAPQ